VLSELRVCQLGVIEEAVAVFEPGVTALTGETGAGKTLLVGAIDLLTGGPAQTSMVRPGAPEALVEGRFVDGDEEVVLARVVAAAGRSRAYVDGRMVPLGRLAELGRALVDLHGQHSQQSLLSPAAQRSALDLAGGVSTERLTALRRRARELKEAQAALGGDERERARQADLLSYQLAEIDSARLEDPAEDDALRAEEEMLSDAAGLAEAAAGAWRAITGDEGIVDRLGEVAAAVSGRPALSAAHDRLLGAAAELSDVAAEARRLAETVESDPARLAAVGERRRVLAELRRKYGGSLAEVIAFRETLRSELDELLARDERAAAVAAQLQEVEVELAAESERVWTARSSAARSFSAEVEAELRSLAMPGARFAVDVGEGAVTWMLGANPGEPLLPLSKVASGGELARAMLAARLVVGRAGGRGGPPTLVFDEVDAGVGGEAALAVGRALAALSPPHQVLVVTHLAQVAAFADHQLAVAKALEGERTVARVRPVEGEERVAEIARMLSGRPGSDSARRHAAELLVAAAGERGSTRNGSARR
jgi:DNA repair protein RecN (Recombination protein N)